MIQVKEDMIDGLKWLQKFIWPQGSWFHKEKPWQWCLWNTYLLRVALWNQTVPHRKVIDEKKSEILLKLSKNLMYELFIISVSTSSHISAVAGGLALAFIHQVWRQKKTLVHINIHNQCFFSFATLLRLWYSGVSNLKSFFELWHKIKTVVTSKYNNDYLCKHSNLRCLRHNLHVTHL